MRWILFCCFFIASQFVVAQPGVADLRSDVKESIQKGEYDQAILLLQNHLDFVCNDTSGLFDVLIDLYSFEKRWMDIQYAYKIHPYHQGEDTTSLATARFCSQFPPESIACDGPVLIPFRHAVGGSPVIEVNVNGKLYHFWFDTGSGMTVLTSSAAKKCNVKRANIPHGLATAASGKEIAMDVGMIDSLSIGRLTIHQHPVMILNTNDLEWKILDIPVMKIDGFIGWNLLQELDVTLNNKSDSITLADYRSFENNTRNFFWMNVPLIQCTEDSGDSCLFTIDTGSGGAAVYDPFLLKAAAANGEKKKVIVSSAGGTKVLPSFRVPSIKLNILGKHISMRNVLLYPHHPNKLFAVDGVLGMKQFEKSVVHFNVRKGFFIIND